ncbi:translation initiation factor IF-2-like [Herpailurus yagouaroundi]|uniref:translation initiation factor IF-2-like n=1 Tax=Herpailurus yagouaroundi TaxID=1608482 RepID=UPI001AD76EBB|nr:translation initiation factor IF-2-like [Puma yagouaroundi]
MGLFPPTVLGLGSKPSSVPASYFGLSEQFTPWHSPWRGLQSGCPAGSLSSSPGGGALGPGAGTRRRGRAVPGTRCASGRARESPARPPRSPGSRFLPRAACARDQPEWPARRAPATASPPDAARTAGPPREGGSRGRLQPEIMALLTGVK